MSQDTIFGRIVRGELPCDKVYEDDEVLAFRDINPAAPTHVLVIPKRPIATLDAAQPGDAALLGRMLTTLAQLARDLGVAEDGYRVVINCNQDGGQTVYHLHMHLLAGRALSWPPG
jgi:histidine triad (HIT) family protein